MFRNSVYRMGSHRRRHLIAVVWLLTTTTSGYVVHSHRHEQRHVRRLSSQQDTWDLTVVASALGLDLSLRGGSWWALCPFHDERTPSFHIDAEKGYYCFGCGAHGHALQLVEHMRECTRQEARQWLEDLDDVPPPAPKPVVEANVPADEMRAAVAKCAKYYASALARSPEAGAARRYLWERGISPKTAALFGLGYAPTQSSLPRIASREALVAAGVAFPGETLKDRFAGRLILPIRDAAGTPVGFGSRTLPEHIVEGRIAWPQRKYVNSPASDIFAKSSLLYGLDVAASAIRDKDQTIIVEGYFDVLALHDMGIHNVVGCLGVGSLGPKLIEQAARFSDSRRVVLLMDSDTAGENALDNLVTTVLPDLVENCGLDVRIAHLPDGYKDAADYVLDKRCLDHFQTTVLDAALPWSHRRASTLLGDVFAPGSSGISSSSSSSSETTTTAVRHGDPITANNEVVHDPPRDDDEVHRPPDPELSFAELLFNI